MPQTYKININATTPTTAIFQPNPLNVQPGDAIYWCNNTANIHQPVMKIPGGVWNLVDEIPGRTGGQDPATSGIMSPPNNMTINYYCANHPSEIGTIQVGPPPAETASEDADA